MARHTTRRGPKPLLTPKLRAARLKAAPDAYVSPQDGTPVVVDTGAQTFTDQHGNVATMSGMAGSRAWRRIRRWLIVNFGA